MTAFQELQAIAQALDPWCRDNKLEFTCLQAEQDSLLTPPGLARARLSLSQVSEQLACGHLVSTAEGHTLFIRVRTPFSATDTLKFVNLRTYSLILAQARLSTCRRFDRDLASPSAPPDLWELLNQATAVAVQAPLQGHLFLQPDDAAPFPTKTDRFLAVRATFCTGILAGTILSA